MALQTERKKQVIKDYRVHDTDTGSPESQIALFTYRINHLTEHLKANKKDFATQQGLLKLVGKRRKLLSYLSKNDIERYRSIIAELNLRK